MLFDWFAVVASEFGTQLAMLVALAYGAYKFHRVKSILGSLVGSVGFAATVGAVVVGAVVLASVVGWISVNPGQMLGDIAGGAGAVWDLVGKGLVDWALGGI